MKTRVDAHGSAEPHHQTREHDRALLRNVAARIPHPEEGLPDEVFDFVRRLVPMINVDLFLVGEDGRVLLAWREDPFADGWHVPGGIVRGRETVETRLERTARDELGAAVRAQTGPAALLQLFGERGHFISLVYRCALAFPPSRRIVAPAERPQPGDLCWFEAPPTAFYPTHEIYRPLWRALRAQTAPAAPVWRTMHVAESERGRRGWRPE